MCKAVIDLIIKKAWTQPKYAASYAKICQIFSKSSDNFQYKFRIDEKESKNTPFKHLLIEKVQQSFMERK